MYTNGRTEALQTLGLEKVAVGESSHLMPPVTGRGAKTMAGIGAAGLGMLGLGAAGVLGGAAAAGTAATGLARGAAATGRGVLGMMRASPKTTTGVALGGAGLSALDGNSPGRVLADGLMAPISWHGGFAAGSTLGRRAAGAAGNLMSKVPGVSRAANALGQRFPGTADFMRGMGQLGSETAGMSTLHSAGESAQKRMGR